MYILSQDVQQEVAASACSCNMDLWICVSGAHFPVNLGTVWAGLDSRILHNYSRQEWQNCKAVSIRVRIFIAMSGYHSVLCEVSERENIQDIIVMKDS